MSQNNLNGLNKKTLFRILLVSVMLIGAIYYVYFVPRVKYAGKTLTKEILDSIPMQGLNWQGTRVQDVNTNLRLLQNPCFVIPAKAGIQVVRRDWMPASAGMRPLKGFFNGLNLEGDVYNFISRIFARQYQNITRQGEVLLFIVLDAGNFHYPRVCFTGAGFKSEELEGRELNLKSGKLKAHLMLSEKKDAKLLSVYWICIDKKIVPTWTKQKLQQFYYSLFNKERVGVMMRIDIPVTGDIDNSVEIAKNFLNDLYQAVPYRYRDYIFSDFNRQN